MDSKIFVSDRHHNLVWKNKTTLCSLRTKRGVEGTKLPLWWASDEVSPMYCCDKRCVAGETGREPEKMRQKRERKKSVYWQFNDLWCAELILLIRGARGFRSYLLELHSFKPHSYNSSPHAISNIYLLLTFPPALASTLSPAPINRNACIFTSNRSF